MFQGHKTGQTSDNEWKQSLHWKAIFNFYKECGHDFWEVVK